MEVAPIVLLEEDAGGEKESRPSYSNAARHESSGGNGGPRGNLHIGSRPQAGAGAAPHTPHADLRAEHERQHDEDEAFVRQQRAEAESLFARRHALMDQSRAAWDSGDHAGAKRLSEEGKAAGAAAAAAQDAAAEAIFAYKNSSARLQPEEMDLHGLHVDEALRFTSRRVQADRSRGARLLVVIYGAGHHSAANKQHLKPAVLAHLASQEGLAPDQIQVDYDALARRANPGCCTVTYPALSPVATIAAPLGPAPDRPAAPPALVVRAANSSPAPATVVVVNPTAQSGSTRPSSSATASESGWTACCVVM